MENTFNSLINKFPSSGQSSSDSNTTTTLTEKKKVTLDSYYSWVPDFSNLIYSDQIMELDNLDLRDQIDSFLDNLPAYCPTHNESFSQYSGCSGRIVHASNSNNGTFDTSDAVICDAGHCYPAGCKDDSSCDTHNVAKQAASNSRNTNCNKTELDPANYGSKFG